MTQPQLFLTVISGTLIALRFGISAVLQMLTP